MKILIIGATGTIGKAVFENLEEMRTLLPVFADLNEEFMLSPYHAAPWHPGALKYFQEAGIN